jgi:hypothetical protein
MDAPSAELALACGVFPAGAVPAVIQDTVGHACLLALCRSGKRVGQVQAQLNAHCTSHIMIAVSCVFPNALQVLCRP